MTASTNGIDVLALLPVPVLIFQEGQVVFANDACRELFGADGTPADQLLKPIGKLLHRFAPRARGKRAASGRKGPPAPIPVQVTRADGRELHLEVTGSGATWDGHPAVQLCLRDASAERHATAKLDNLANGSIAGILIHRDMRPLFVNDAYANMYGYESKDQILQMQSILQLTDPEDRGKVWGYYQRRMKGEQVPSRYVHRSRMRDGRQIYVDNLVSVVDWEGRPAVQVTNLDVTRYYAAQTVAEWERQALMGAVAGGMAKRFVRHAGQLSGELGQALLYAYMEGKGEALERMRAMENILQRMQGDLDALLVAAREGSQVEHRVALKQLIAETVKDRLQPSTTLPIRRTRIALSIEDEGHPTEVAGDRLHIRRALNAILDIAMEAMPRGGAISISVRTLTLKHATKVLPSGRYLAVEVADEGPGVDPGDLHRIGEPFFTRKDGHAGLGLSTSLTIMRRHRGYLDIRRVHPHGTAVSLYFPVAREAAPG